jgi:2-oxoisovalerate ferredoxin oxidoreductase alpha subunit
MAKQLIKGNEAIVKGAILAGCRAYFGYPITPASEIAHAAARYMPLVGGTFLQAESEIAAINMVYGSAGTGMRVMTASSSPGMSLKQEGISYIAGAELPCVIVDIMRAGPGLGNIAPEQSDYHQMVKGGGHGNYKNIVLAPNSAQEMCDLTILAFDLADKYRNPAVVLADGFIGQMMEPVQFPEPTTEFIDKNWVVRGINEDRENLISSIEIDPDDLERHNEKLQKKYAFIAHKEVRVETYEIEDAEYVLIGYGIVSRLIQTAVDQLRNEGVKVGMLRPITLMPFPTEIISKLGDNPNIKGIFVSELSNGQMVEDVRLAINGRKKVWFHGRMGGNIPTTQELVDELKKHMKEQS